MYNVNLTTEDRDFAKIIMDYVIDAIDEFEPDGYTNYFMSNVIDEEEEEREFEHCSCCECGCEEEDWAELKGLGFGIAFDFLTENPEFGMRLPCWGDDRVIRIQYPDENSFMTHPYLYIETEHENIPFVVDYMSLFSNDWEIVE